MGISGGIECKVSVIFGFLSYWERKWKKKRKEVLGIAIVIYISSMDTKGIDLCFY